MLCSGCVDAVGENRPQREGTTTAEGEMVPTSRPTAPCVLLSEQVWAACWHVNDDGVGIVSDYSTQHPELKSDAPLLIAHFFVKYL